MNKKQKELYKNLKIDINNILLIFYETKEHKDYEEQSKFYLENREQFIKEKLIKLDYFVSDNFIIKDNVRIDTKEIKK